MSQPICGPLTGNIALWSTYREHLRLCITIFGTSSSSEDSQGGFEAPSIPAFQLVHNSMHISPKVRPSASNQVYSGGSISRTENLEPCAAIFTQFNPHHFSHFKKLSILYALDVAVAVGERDVDTHVVCQQCFFKMHVRCAEKGESNGVHGSHVEDGKSMHFAKT